MPLLELLPKVVPVVMRAMSPPVMRQSRSVEMPLPPEPVLWQRMVPPEMVSRESALMPTAPEVEVTPLSVVWTAVPVVRTVVRPPAMSILPSLLSPLPAGASFSTLMTPPLIQSRSALIPLEAVEATLT